MGRMAGTVVFVAWFKRFDPYWPIACSTVLSSTSFYGEMERVNGQMFLPPTLSIGESATGRVHLRLWRHTTQRVAQASLPAKSRPESRSTAFRTKRVRPVYSETLRRMTWADSCRRGRLRSQDACAPRHTPHLRIVPPTTQAEGQQHPGSHRMNWMDRGQRAL